MPCHRWCRCCTQTLKCSCPSRKEELAAFTKGKESQTEVKLPKVTQASRLCPQLLVIFPYRAPLGSAGFIFNLPRACGHAALHQRQDKASWRPCLETPGFSSPGSVAVLSAEQNHKIDTSIHYNIPELQSSSRVPLPQHNGQQELPSGRKGPPTQEMEPDSEEEEGDEDGDEEEEEAPRRKWQGIEAIFEAYQEHVEGTRAGGGQVKWAGGGATVPVDARRRPTSGAASESWCWSFFWVPRCRYQKVNFLRFLPLAVVIPHAQI